MGILDDVLGTNTASGQDAAAAQNNALISATQNNNSGILQNSATNASTALTGGATNATNAINAGYGAGTSAVSGAGTQAQGLLSNGVNNAVSTDQSSNSNYTPYTTTGTAATGMLDNALGLNGAAGNTAATNAFTSAPGYQYTVDQASDAAARKAASLGLSASGNTLAAITTLGSNLANQNYQQYVSNLQNAGSQGLTAAQGISSNNQAAGTAQLTGGTAGATDALTTGTNLGTLDAAQGTANANIQTGLGTGVANVNTGLGTSLVSNNQWGTGAITANTTAAAKADDTATNQNSGIFSKNIQGAAGGLLSGIGL